MGQNFERQLVNAFNDYFEKHRRDPTRGISEGVAFRDTQHKYADQKLDIFIDNPDIGIECKSVKTDNTNKLYFSQHFSEKDGQHQVENITDYLFRSDRKGFLAIYVRRGRGKKGKGYLVEWEHVQDLYYSDDEAGIELRTLDKKAEEYAFVLEIPRDNGGWTITPELWNEITEFL